MSRLVTFSAGPLLRKDLPSSKHLSRRVGSGCPLLDNGIEAIAWNECIQL